ncbi:hypothetical protein NCC49_003277 [Naganishia albida]|nr:hypothetical protein NCC49_003277 [Naganishia albida]
MLESAIEDMDYLTDPQEDLEGVGLPSKGLSPLIVLRASMNRTWADFKAGKKRLDQSLLVQCQSEEEEEVLKVERKNLLDAAQHNLAVIRGELKTFGEKNPSLAAAELILAFDQIALWWASLYALTQECRVLLPYRSSRTGITIIEDCELKTSQWHSEAIEMDSTLRHTGTLPRFSSLENFSAFCKESEKETTIEMIAKLLTGQYE